MRDATRAHLHSMDSTRSQYEQSAAPPAMVPSRYGLISITFFTVCEAVYADKAVTSMQRGDMWPDQHTLEKKMLRHLCAD